MDTFAFSGSVLVEAQGSRVLTLIGRHPDHAEYQVIGFHSTVTIRDFRPLALAALDAYADGCQTMDFATAFSQPAAAELTVHDESILVDLYDDPHQTEPDYMLWIAVGLENELPVLDYIVAKFELLSDRSLAVVALCRLAEVDALVELPIFSAAAF